MAGSWDKEAILRRMRAERKVFQETMGKLSEEEKCTIAMQGEWTARDIAAHLAAWERQLVVWLRTAAAGKSPQLPAPDAWEPYISDFNARCYEENCERSLAEVMAESEDAFREVMGELEALPDQAGDPVWELWDNEEPPKGLLVTFHRHYRGHLLPIREWLAESGRG